MGDRDAVFQATDVRDADAVAALAESTAAQPGALDVVVNNAGRTAGLRAGHPASAPRADHHLNLIAAYVAQRANDVMQAQPRGGSIINIGSLNGMSSSPGVAAYGAPRQDC